MDDEEMARKRTENLDSVLNSAARHRVIVAGPGTGKTFTFKKVLERVDGPALVLSFLGSLVGGYHLAGAAMERRIPATVDDLDRLISPRVVAPAHCTGWRAAHALAERFSPRRFAPSTVGSSYTLTASQQATD